jgi:sirohydrochlorin cobaltochelatase
MTDRQALVVVAHGSHLDARSAEPAFDHAAAVRERGLFDEVRTAFWKEEPSFRNALRTVESDRVYAVPLFTSEGYFTTEVVPRELGLGDPARDGGTDPARAGERVVRYADPVGTHDAMTDVIEQRAETVTGNADVGPGVGVAVVGHGTERSETSARSTRRHAERLRATGRFDQVEALFLDEPPYVDDLAGAFDTDDVVVVPLFVADGYHTQEDIPRAVGLTDDPATGYEVPATVDGRRVWYAGAVGTEPLVADVIVERAVEAGADPDHDADDLPLGDEGSARRAFLQWLDGDADPPSDPDAPFDRRATRTWGELAVAVAGTRDDGRVYELCHRDDADAPAESLDAHDGPDAAWRLARFDDDGRYRPLSGAPTLPTGWRLPGLDAREVVRAVLHVYPASVENWHRSRTGSLDATHFRETAARQTGIYADVGDLAGSELACAVEACCAGCVKRREWDEGGGDSLDVARGDGRIPCREPCSFFVAAAQAFLDGQPPADDARSGSTGGSVEPLSALAAAAGDRDPPVREAAFDEDGNPYRRRFRQAKRARLDAGEVSP